MELLCKNAPDRVLELREWGCPFNVTNGGKINQRYFGAQAYRRTCFVGDRTGDAIEKTLVEKAKELDVPYRDKIFITKLLGDQGKIAGAIGYEMDTGTYIVFKVRAVVLAAGGYSQVYKRSSSREDENTADGPALAYELGVPLQDMEMVQFHPTGMVKPEGMRGSLVTEAVRGEGGKLYNTNGERFMKKYAPEQMELAARDVVARANYQEIKEGRGTENGGVLLDISHKDLSFIKERLPSMYEKFKEQNVDISEEAMEVAPTAHYSMGGIKTDFVTGQTNVEGLFAIGEVTAGLHGGNRLGGNSLAEVVTFGKICGDHIAQFVQHTSQEILPQEQIHNHLDHLNNLVQSEGDYSPHALIEDVRNLLWDHAGIIRNEELINEGISQLTNIRKRAQKLHISGDRTSKQFEYALDLHFMLPIADAILKSALKRKESRAAHYREHHPESSKQWRKNILVQKDAEGNMTLSVKKVGRIPQVIQKAMKEEHKLEYHHLE